MTTTSPGQPAAPPRPAVDPVIPAAARQLLLAPGAPLTPASQPAPAPNRGHASPPARRGPATGLVIAAVTALAGWVLLAPGQGAGPLPNGRQDPFTAMTAGLGHWLLWLALLTAVGTILATATTICLAGTPGAETAAARAARTWHGRYLTPADLDPAAAALLARAQHATGTITAAPIYRDGLLDDPPDGAGLARHEWDIAQALRQLTCLRRNQANTGASAARRHALTDAQAAAEPPLSGDLLDLLAATARDEHATADLAARTQRATAARHALTELTGGDQPTDPATAERTNPT